MTKSPKPWGSAARLSGSCCCGRAMNCAKPWATPGPRLQGVRDNESCGRNRLPAVPGGAARAVAGAGAFGARRGVSELPGIVAGSGARVALAGLCGTRARPGALGLDRDAWLCRRRGVRAVDGNCRAVAAATRPGGLRNLQPYQLVVFPGSLLERMAIHDQYFRNHGVDHYGRSQSVLFEA